ncbi:MAG: T9SS type A sorting domain-containing protein [Bacteroidetes bacterium]|nr:T9SS type A sorting domain-containing protein [Bacteroidota bacterium]
MKSKLIVLLSIFGMTTGFGRPAIGLIRSEGDSATVTFKVNTAFVQDTLTPGSVVSFRGTAFGGDWSLEKGIKLKNVGGDYWEAEKKVPLGSSGGTFKIVTQTETGTGWDRHDQSAFIIENDTTIELFTTGLKETYTDPVTGTEITRGDDWNPLELAKNGDTSVFAVHFRVNMQGVLAFNPTKHTATVRGSFNGWSAADTLKPESRHDDLSGVYGVYESEKYLFSKTILIPKASAGILKYKFVWSDSGAISTNWEDKIGGDRTIQLGRDTTLAWKWFDNTAPIICIDDIFFQIVLNVDLEKAISANGFNPQTDTLIAVAGFLGTASRPVEFELHPSSGTVYTGSDSVSSGFNSTVFYKYFKKSGSIRIEESYLDFNDPKTSRSAPLYRKIVMPSIGVSVSGWDIDKSDESSHRQPVFRSSVPMTDSTQVILHVDLRPVFFFVKRLGDSLSYSPPVSRYYLTEKNIDLQRLFCASPTYCWMCMGPWAPPEMNDKGLDGDKIAGDSVYSITMKVKKGELSSVEYQLAFGWMPNESSFLNTRFHNLEQKPVNEFSFQFGDIEPDRYKNDKGFWDFNTKKGVVTSVNDIPDSEIPKKIKISAYPNPFNPATLITYSIPQSGKVSLKVFDLLGRQVALLAEEIKPAGTHQIPFRGDDLSSGIYLVRMESVSKTESVKVILLK